MGSREIGRKSDVFLALVTLRMGTIADFFQFEGGLPHAMKWLKSLVIDGAMEYRLADIYFQPVSATCQPARLDAQFT